MNSFQVICMLAVTTICGCATVPTAKVATVPQEKPVEIVAESKPLLLLPAGYTQKGVTVKIDGLWQATDGQILGVSGTAKNVAASDLRFCQITFAFLDAAGNTLDDAKASTKSLKSAQVWHFQAALAHPSTAARYTSITPARTVAIPVKAPDTEMASLK